MNKNKQIRNSTAEFLIFTSQDGKNSIEARCEDETIWLTQKLMGELFEVGTNTVNYHLKEIFKSGEADENRTIRKFRITADNGRAILQDAGKISAQIAKEKAETEFEKYRIIQDSLFESDFDKEIKKLFPKQ